MCGWKFTLKEKAALCSQTGKLQCHQPPSLAQLLGQPVASNSGWCCRLSKAGEEAQGSHPPPKGSRHILQPLPLTPLGAISSKFLEIQPCTGSRWRVAYKHSWNTGCSASPCLEFSCGLTSWYWKGLGQHCVLLPAFPQQLQKLFLASLTLA